MKQIRRIDLVEPELSFQIVGALFDVFNALGTGHRETIYQRALSEAFQERGLFVNKEVYAPLRFRNKIIGRWRLDFLVENRIVVEVKRGERIMRPDILQVLEYLKTNNLKLGILANFAPDGLQLKRVVNLNS